MSRPKRSWIGVRAMVLLDKGDKVKVLVYPDKPIGIVVRRCHRDNRYIYVDVPSREGGLLRVRDDKVKKI